VLAGPAYALLRPQFAAARAASLARRRARPPLRELLIALGGVDADNHTTAVLSALAALGGQALPPEARIRVVMGPTAPVLAAVRAQAAAMPWPTSVQVGVDDMAALMHEADLAIGAAGVSAWERCCLGLPTLLMVLADNQRPGAAALQAAGAARVVAIGEPSARPSAKVLSSVLLAALQALHEGEVRAAMAEAAAAVIDGQGAERVADILEAAHA
jgi:UDP-2,4-diacetamido-2,4,6-trideoxy-beta-L-altropyranose hydrolase